MGQLRREADRSERKHRKKIRKQLAQRVGWECSTSSTPGSLFPEAAGIT